MVKRDVMGAFSDRAEAVRTRVGQARKQARRVAKEMARNLNTAREEAETTARGLGVPLDDGPVIDLGVRPSTLRRVGAAMATSVLALLIAGSLLSFTSFLFQLLIATLLANKVLGINFDFNSFAQRVRA